MSEHGLHGIEASLRRQFEPPNLDALGDRIAAAAALVHEDDGETALEPGLRSATVARRRLGLGVLVAIAAAAAIALLLARPSDPDRAPERIAAVTEAESPTTHQIAGRQLHDFLRSAAYQQGPVPDDMNCMADGSPTLEVVPEPGAPMLPPSPDLRVVWECGGATGIDCAAHDLPAQRMMVVQLMPAGPEVIVCIEPPWADPKPELPAGSGYKIFRRMLGGYVLYEITPLDAARAIDSITI